MLPNIDTIDFKSTPLIELLHFKSMLDAFIANRCLGKCDYCDGNGELTIPHADLYETILMHHQVIADYELRKLIIGLNAEILARNISGTPLMEHL